MERIGKALTLLTLLAFDLEWLIGKSSVLAASDPPSFINCETAPVYPVALSPNGRTLALCNLPDARLELFAASSGVPVPTGSVLVGLDPVSVRFHTDKEIWVVNHLSDSVSVIDVETKHVVATLDTPEGRGEAL